MHLSVKFKKLILSVKLYLKICKNFFTFKFQCKCKFFKKINFKCKILFKFNFNKFNILIIFLSAKFTFKFKKVIFGGRTMLG